VTRAALVTVVVALGLATLVQVLGAAHFAQDALLGRGTSWLLAAVALLGGGLSAALTIVAGQALVHDLRTRPTRSRQDEARAEPADDSPGPLPAQRSPGTNGAAGPARARSRGGVHRAGRH
jgi:hypothetical protein